MESCLDAVEGVRCDYEWSITPPSVAVIETIEQYQHSTPGEAASGIDEPLQHYIATDALDTALKSNPTMAIAFTLDDYIVEIDEQTVCVCQG